MSLPLAPGLDDLHVTIENLTTLTHVQWQLVAVLLMVGYGAHLAFSVFFLAASTQVAPRYRLVPWMSAVVMLAAGLSLFREFSAWKDTYSFVGTLWVPNADFVFDNAYRYANWTITLPLLLAQLLIALNLPQRTLRRRFVVLVAASWLMVWTGLIGQFFENASVGAMLFWGFVSTIPFVVLVYAVWRSLREARATTPTELHPWLKNLFYFFLFFWGLYAIAYMVPAFGDEGGAVVIRQLLYTIADVFSKLVFGLILSRFVLRRSAMEGYGPARDALASWEGLTLTGGGTETDAARTPSDAPGA